MRTALIFAILAAAAVPAGAQERLADQLRKGVIEEEVNQNVDKAIQAYQSIVARYDEDRKAAGSALYRLAECYRKAGKREQAIAAYQRVTREFADQATIAQPSRQQLAALGVPEPREVRPERASTTGVREAPREVRPESVREREVRPKATTVDPADAYIRQYELQMRAQQIDLSNKRLDDAQKRLADAQKFMSEVESMKQRPANYDTIVANLRQAQADVEQLRTEREAAVLAYQQQKEESQAREREAQDRRQLTERLIKSVQVEIVLVQQQIKNIEQKVSVGTVSAQDTELLQLRRDLLALQRKLDELRLQGQSIR